jgi:hypothetical protein
MVDSVCDREIANTAIDLWHGDKGSLRYVGRSTNQIYSFIESGEPRFLQLISSCDRTKQQVEAELDFIVSRVS